MQSCHAVLPAERRPNTKENPPSSLIVAEIRAVFDLGFLPLSQSAVTP
jgi:hypothetical protein